MSKIKIEATLKNSEGNHIFKGKGIKKDNQIIYLDKKIQTKDLCEVVMSPQHAKALIKTLEDAIENYESNFGEIILTPRNSEKDNNNEK